MKFNKSIILAIYLLGFTNILLSQALPNYVPSNGLVGWWPFNGNANDESGNGNNGTVNGATLTTDRFGNAEHAYDFDGINDFVEVLHDQEFNTLPLSVVAWIKTNQCCVEGSSIASKYYYASSNGWGLSYRAWSGTHGGFYSTVESQTQDTSTIYVNDNEWHMVTMTVDNASFKIYEGGQLISENIWNGQPQSCNNSQNILFGKSDFPTNVPINGHFEGAIDDIAIYNRALTIEEIQQLYTINACTFTIYDTVTVTQTVYDTVSISVSTTDTLIINTLITQVQPAQENTFLVYPNPAGSQITINNGNVGILGGYTMRITNSAGQEVYNQNITQTEVTLDLSNWGGNGLYVMYVVDPQGEIIAVKQIVLQ
jgi:hypothetical protein